MADDATAATAEDAPAVRPSSSLDEILGQIDSTLAAGAPEPEPEPEPSGTTPPVPVPVPVPPTLDDDLNALLAATGLDGGGSGDGNGNDGGVDDAFDDIFGPSTSVGTQQGPPPPASSQGAGGTGSGAAPAVASASASASESTAWKNFDAAERADFLKWLEEDDVAQGLDAALLLDCSSKTGGAAVPSVPAPAPAPAPSASKIKPPLPTPAAATPASVASPQTAAAAAVKGSCSTAPAPLTPSLDSIILSVGHGQGSPLDAGARTPEAILERIREMLAAPPSTVQEPQPPHQAQRFFAGGGGGVGNEGTRAGVALQAYCEEYKGVPDGLRGPVWRRILPSHEPLAQAFTEWLAGEAKDGQGEDGWRLGTVHRRHGVPNQVLIRRDAAAVTRAFLSPGAVEEAFAAAIEKGLTFYCKYLHLDYEPSMGPIYGALASCLGEWEDKPHEILGRFHAFVRWLLPSLLMDAAPGGPREGWVKEVHTEFRLLLTYHAPLLVQHLDRACPCWELPPRSLAAEGGLAKAEQARADAEAEDILGALEGKWSTPTPTATTSGSPHATTTTAAATTAGESPSLAVERGKSAGALGEKGGLLPTTWLLGLYSGSALLPPSALLALWDAVLIRGDRFLGMYLTAALLLRRKSELLALQGPALRARLETLTTTTNPIGDGSVLPPVGEWVEGADRLERLTPASFRVHLTALEAAAALASRPGASLSASVSRSSGGSGGGGGKAEGQQLTPTPPQGPPPSPGAAVVGAGRLWAPGDEAYAARLAALTGRRQRAIDEMVQQQQAQAPLGASTSGSGSSAQQPKWGIASPTRRRRALQQAAADPDALALLSTKLCLSVAPEEAVPQLCLPSSGTGVGLGGVRFFGLDCRPKEQLSAGRFPTAYHLDPSQLEDPEEITRLLTTLEPFKGGKHILLIGTGDRSNLVAAPAATSQASPLGGNEKTAAARMREQLQRAAREDLAHLNTAALFLLKRGFPFVSILEGGFVATHAYLLQRTRERNSGLATSAGGPPGLGLSALIDHVPNHCRMCKHEALLRFHRDQAASLGDSGSGSGASSGLAAAQKALHRAGSSLQNMAAGEAAPSLAALSQLGQSSLETLRSKATGLFGKLGSASSSAADGGGSPGSAAVDVHEVGSFLKGTVLSVAKRAEQAMEARGVKVPHALPTPVHFGGGGGGSEGGGSGGAKQPSPGVALASPSVFVIEDDEAEEEEEEGGGEEEKGKGEGKANAPSPPPTAVVPKRTSDVDRELALKLHALNGLQKGQEVEVSPEALPGAQLFSVYKQKPAAGGEQQQEGAGGGGAAVEERPRYIALTAERMLVLETAGGLSAQQGRVKSNHHLTELGRMTFNKKQPDVVNLYFRQGGMMAGPAPDDAGQQQEEMKRRSYRIARKDEFIACLQERLRRFK